MVWKILVCLLFAAILYFIVWGVFFAKDDGEGRDPDDGRGMF